MSGFKIIPKGWIFFCNSKFHFATELSINFEISEDPTAYSNSMACTTCIVMSLTFGQFN